MGNTIRREPISTRIPASPDYKYLNITDFRGISQSDNPFILDYKTASDSLNVYVDESNTLTTRPRLEKILDRSWTTNISKFYGLYPLSIGYLLHCQISGTTNIMYIVYKVNGGYSHTSIDNPHNISFGDQDLLVFEQDDIIYAFTGSKYVQITYSLDGEDVTDAVISEAEVYIPTVIDGSTNTQQGEKIESRNILTNKYKESFFWDGTWSPSDVRKKEDDEIYNGYESREYTAYGFVDTILRILPSEEPKKRPWFLYREGDSLELSDGYSSGRSIGKPIVLPEKYTASKLYGDCTDDKSVVVAYYGTSSTSSSSVDGGVFVYRDNGWSTLLADAQHDMTIEQLTTQPIAINNAGSLVCFSAHVPASSKREFYAFEWDGEQYSQTFSYEMSATNNTIKIARDAKTAAFIAHDGSLRVINRTAKTEHTISAKNIVFFDISPDGSYVFIKDADGGRFVKTDAQTSENVPTEIQSILNGIIIGGFSQTGNKFYVLSGINGTVNITFNGYLLLKSFYDASAVKIESYLEQSDVASVTRFDTNRIDYVSGKSINTILYDFTSTKPEMILTSTYSSNTSKEKALLLKSKITTRFDYERWFASGNLVFRTLDNNPTYIPETSVVSLGDSEKPITGFNLVQDDLLVVYKNNILWSVVPVSLEDSIERQYQYRETKNTVGNDAVGATIVSAYSEIPLQITRDGVYGLKQLTNVFASDRISELMSEPITQKWKNESAEVIEQLKTLNNLYWTYFVLPYKDKQMTKIYLLDNRTSSWYYWELPIVVKNIFVANNTIEITDIDGNFYRLTTGDVCKEYKTEYYDDGKKIIPWFWKSQILPLGTMNYSKKLVDTTFIFTDTAANDAYGLNYTFNAYRKSVSATNETTISNNLNYVQSTTKKTLIPRFNFVQLTLSNIPENLNHNKLRLVGLGLKYVLLEGLL